MSMGDGIKVIPSGHLCDTNIRLLLSQPEVLPFACPQVPMVLLRCASRNASCARLHTAAFPKRDDGPERASRLSRDPGPQLPCGPGSVSPWWGWHSLLACPLRQLPAVSETPSDTHTMAQLPTGFAAGHELLAGRSDRPGVAAGSRWLRWSPPSFTRSRDPLAPRTGLPLTSRTLETLGWDS